MINIFLIRINYFYFFGETGVWIQGFVLRKQVLYCLSLGDGVSVAICLGWPQTVILQISASLVAMITDVSHQNPT
jgi:hypothetical protein